MCSAGSNRHAFKHTAKWNSAFRWWSGAFLIFCGMGCPQELPRGVTQRSRFPACALFGPTALGRNCPACRSSAPAFSVAVDGQLAPSTRHPVLRPHSAKPVCQEPSGQAVAKVECCWFEPLPPCLTPARRYGRSLGIFEGLDWERSKRSRSRARLAICGIGPRARFAKAEG